MKFKYESTLKQITFVQSLRSCVVWHCNGDNKIKNCTKQWETIRVAEKKQQRINLYNLFKYTGTIKVVLDCDSLGFFTVS